MKKFIILFFILMSVVLNGWCEEMTTETLAFSVISESTSKSETSYYQLFYNSPIFKASDENGEYTISFIKGDGSKVPYLYFLRQGAFSDWSGFKFSSTLYLYKGNKIIIESTIGKPISIEFEDPAIKAEQIEGEENVLTLTVGSDKTYSRDTNNNNWKLINAKVTYDNLISSIQGVWSESNMQISTAGQVLTVTGITPHSCVIISTLNGKIEYNGIVTKDNFTMNLKERGVYVLQIGAQIFKILVL